MLSDYRDSRAKEFVAQFVGKPERAKLKRKVTETTINRELGLLQERVARYRQAQAEPDPQDSLFPNGERARQCPPKVF